jgi:hypothetical protein
VTLRASDEKRDSPLISLLFRACSGVQGTGDGLKLAKNGETAEKELCLLLLAREVML